MHQPTNETRLRLEPIFRSLVFCGILDSQSGLLQQFIVGSYEMLSNLAQFDLGQFGAWIVMSIAAVAILVVVLKIVSKVISTSLRLIIIVGSLLVIAAAMFILTMLLQGEAPGL